MLRGVAIRSGAGLTAPAILAEVGHPPRSLRALPFAGEHEGESVRGDRAAGELEPPVAVGVDASEPRPAIVVTSLPDLGSETLGIRGPHGVAGELLDPEAPLPRAREA